jgi:hypothetical protein
VQFAFLDSHSLKGTLGAQAVPFRVRGRPRFLGVENMLASVIFGIIEPFIEKLIQREVNKNIVKLYENLAKHSQP